MKWKIFCYLPLLFIFFSCGLPSCCSTKKIQTRTITETKIKIDTIIKIKNDTILKIQTVTLHDTAILENKTMVARSYFSTQKQRIVLELKGKNFDVPVTIYKYVKQVEEKKEKIKEPLIKIQFIVWLLILVLVYFIWKDRKNLFAK